jgi:cell division septum initiation protein DivIVA
MNDWFVIKNLEEFTDKARAIVYNNFGTWDEETQVDQFIDSVKQSDKEDLDKVLSHSESIAIVKHKVKKQKHKKNKSIRYILDEKLFAEIIEDLNSRMVSNILNQLVQKGLVESAFDTESNDFIFWVKDNDKLFKNETETNLPETD